MEIEKQGNLSMKSNVCGKNGIFPTHNSIRESLISLDSLISDRISYMNRKKDKKMIKIYKKTQENFLQYLRHHEKIPIILAQTFKIVQHLENAQRRLKKQGFHLIKKSFLYRFQQLKDYQLKVHVLKEYLSNIINKEQYRELNQSFQAIRETKKKQQGLENVRIFGCRQGKQLDLQDDDEQNSLQKNILDQSVDEKDQKESQILQDEVKLKESLQKKLHELQCEIIRKQREIKQNKLLRQVDNPISGSNRVIETEQNLTINDSSYLKQLSCMRQDSSFSQILGVQNRCTKQTLNDLLQKNRLLQQQADHIRVTNEQLLKIGRNIPNLNPQVLLIFQQVNTILQVSPLGHSQIN